MLPSTCSRDAPPACPPFPRWNLPSFTMKSTLSSPCSRSDPPLSRQGAGSPPHDLVLWTDGSVPFVFGKGGSGVLANCFLCGAEATLSFSAGPVCSSFSAEVCAILHALCWSWQHQQVCHFSSLLFLSDSRSVLATLFSPPSFLLSQTLWQIWKELSSLFSCSIRLQWVPGHSFLPGNDAADELARRGALLAPSAIPCSLFPLTSRIHSRLFTDWMAHGTCFHAARVVSTPSNWKVSLMLCGNRMCPPGRVSTYSDVQGPANQQTSFSGRDDECVAHKLPFSGHIIKKFRGPSILQLNIDGLTASKMNVFHHLAIQLEAFIILLQETHCISAEKLVLSNY